MLFKSLLGKFVDDRSSEFAESFLYALRKEELSLEDFLESFLVEGVRARYESVLFFILLPFSSTTRIFSSLFISRNQ